MLKTKWVKLDKEKVLKTMRSLVLSEIDRIEIEDNKLIVYATNGYKYKFIGQTINKTD